MRNRLARLVSLEAVPGYLLLAWRVVYLAVNAASNADYVKHHVLPSTMWQFLASNVTGLSVVVSALWLTAVVMKPEWFKGKRRIGPITETVSGHKYMNETVRIDGRRFDACTFVACRLEYHGEADCAFDNCKVADNYLLMACDPAVNAFLNAHQKLSSSTEGSFTLWGKQDSRTGEFLGDVTRAMDEKGKISWENIFKFKDDSNKKPG